MIPWLVGEALVTDMSTFVRNMCETGLSELGVDDISQCLNTV